MTLVPPQLDDRSYDDLVREVLALIPSHLPEWTDHNPSDPGITLIELFAWLAEMLIYRADRLTDDQMVTFLQLLNGPQWAPGADLDEDVRTTLLELGRRYRAVTVEDWEALAREASPAVVRARCVPRRDLSSRDEKLRLRPRPGHLSVIVVPDEIAPGATAETDPPLPSEQLLELVSGDLEPRRLVTTRHHVVAPVYTPVGAEMLIARLEDVPEGVIRDRVELALSRYLSPTHGGAAGDGWPFGRDIYVSELYELLEGIPGVDYVPDAELFSELTEEIGQAVEAPALWHDDGSLVGLGLAAHHLPWARIDRERIVTGVRFAQARVALEVAPAPDASSPPPLTARVKTAVKRLFHPLHGGPDGSAPWELTSDRIRQRVLDLDTVASLTGDVRVSVDGRPVGDVRLEAGVFAEVRVRVRVTGGAG